MTYRLERPEIFPQRHELMIGVLNETALADIRHVSCKGFLTNSPVMVDVTTSMTTSTTSIAEFTRLYISPFTPALAPTILPTSASATNISIHEIDNFPERSFGYADLPNASAQNLKRKLNGSTLKGMKMRVEDARPEKRRRPTDAEAQKEDEGERAKILKRARKSKREEGVLPAVELPEGRKVKRGWTQKKDKQRDGEGALIFRTKVPAAKLEENVKGNGGKRKGKKGKDGKIPVELKEFENTTKYPTFLRTSQVSKSERNSISFVDGKGWIDEAGNVVEAVTSQRALQHRQRQSQEKSHDLALSMPKVEEKLNREANVSSKMHASKQSSPSSSSIASSDSESNSDSDSEVDAQSDQENPELGSKEELRTREPEIEPEVRPEIISKSKASSSATPVSSKSKIVKASKTPVSPPPTISAPKPIHPLEALFKKPLPSSIQNNTKSDSTDIKSDPTSAPPRPAPINTSFSFFGENENDNEDENEDDSTLKPPQTPFTRRDLESRGVRSAAPTPDTAAIGKRFRAPWMSTHKSDDSDDDENQDEDDDDDDDDNDDHQNDSEQDSNSHDTQSSDAESVGDTKENLGKDQNNNLASNASAKLAAGNDQKAQEDSKEKEQTEFDKLFYAERGSNNRAWKTRNREARKENRQVENRRRGGG